MGFPFVMLLSSPPGNTAHSSHDLSLCESGYCGWICYADNPASSQCNACKYHRSLDLYFCKQCQIMSWVFSVIWQSFCFDTSSLIHQEAFVLIHAKDVSSGLLHLDKLPHQFTKHGPHLSVLVYITYIRVTIAWPADPRGIISNVSQREISCIYPQSQAEHRAAKCFWLQIWFT